MIDWKYLEGESQLPDLVTESLEIPVIIYKHSPRCGISARAKVRLESNWTLPPGAARMIFVDVVAERELSQRISKLFGVRHESPQILVIQGGNVTHQASHARVTVEEIEKYILPER